MGWDPKHFGSIATLIHNKCKSDNFVFCFDDSQDKPKVIWSAAVRDGKAPHTRAVNMLQHVYQGRASQIETLKMCFAGQPHATDMCIGMLRFLGVKNESIKQVQILKAAHESNFNVWEGLYRPEEAAARSVGLDTYTNFSVGPTPAVDLRIEVPGHHTIHRLYMMAAFAITEERARTGGPKRGHNIGAILVNPEGQILGWGRNEMKDNYTFHAELNAVQSYFHRTGAPIPDDSRLYTTLKPCAMCAGMLSACTETDQRIKVYYGQNDPGDHAKNTALDKYPGMLAQLGTGGVKPLKTYASKFYRDEKERKSPDLAGTLAAERIRAIGEGTYALTNFLDQPAALELMRDARDALFRKGLKYTYRTIGKANVRKVLLQLQPFLVSCGIREWDDMQIIPPEAIDVMGDGMVIDLTGEEMVIDLTV